MKKYLLILLLLNTAFAVDVVRIPFWDSAYIHLDTLDIIWDRIDTTSAVIPKADSSSASFNPLHLSGGFWRDRLTFVVRADGGTCYLVIDNKYTASQDVDVWLSSDGSGGRDGGTVEMYVWEMPDSIALTAGTATTLEENFVYLTYNAGSPALKRHAAEDQKKETGGLIDSMAFVASIGLGAVSGDDEQVRSFITNQPSLYKDAMRSAFHTAPQHHEGIIPTIESHSFSATRGFLRNGRNYELIPAVNTDDVCLYVPVYSDSNYAQWDSLDNFAKYADGDAIGVPHYFWVVIWGAISEDTTEYKLYMNIQAGTNTYLTRETAEQDKDNMLPTDIPDDYHGTGFLIAGIIIHSDEVQALEDGSTYLDLRGQPSGTRGGGGAPPTDSSQVNAWNFVLPPEIHDSLDANWAAFTAGSATVKWRDSSYIYLDTANILAGNTEIKAWLDTTAVRVPIADSTHGGSIRSETCKEADSTDGGATRATTSAVADSTDGGSIRSETCKIADSCDGGAARAEVSDSTNSPFRAAAHDTLWANLEEEIGDSLTELWTAVDKHKNRYVMPNFVHGRPDAPGDNVILSLEGYDAGTLNTWILRDSTLQGNQTDTIHISFVLPWGVTQCDSLVLKYRTLSATTTTSCIANLRLSVDGVSQWTYATDEASVTDERLQLSVADADFDAGELATLQIIFEGDQDAWLKVVYVYLIMSE